MIKVSNNFLNLSVEGFNISYNNKGGISDLFLSILLNLIDSQFSKNTNFLENLSVSEIFNANLNKNLNQCSNLIEKSYENKDLDLISLYLFYLFNNNEPDSLGERNLVNSELNEIYEIKKFQFDEEKLIFIKKLISFMLSHKGINFSQLNQIFEKAFSNFNTENITDKEEGFSQILNISGNENYSKDEILVKENIDWLKAYEFLTQIRDSNKIKDDKIFYIREYKENIQPNKESLQSYVNTIQSNSQHKIEGDPNLQFKNLENNSQNFNNLFSFYLSKKYTNQNTAQNELKEEFSGKGLNIKRELDTLISNHNDLGVKKGEISKEESEFYNFLEKKFKIEVNDFQKIFDVSLIKSDFKMENVVKVDHTKTVDFHKIPDGFLDMIKEMSLKIQPEGEKRAFIKLGPPEMGYLDLEIRVKDKNIEIIARVEKPELLQEMKQSLHHIKAGLEDSGFNLKEIQLFLSSNFNDQNLLKNFSKEERNYSQKTEVEEIKEIDEKGIKNKDLLKFYNKNGKYYYIV
uniref:Flagellar hook-length control protein FliK n=1 Tax=Thermodesulfobacterium geofontis TaxID=1295609 RepID=A0A7V5XHF0_9BACT